MKRATIDDVASLAGVSIKTVSRVLNREPKVRASTMERVQKAMKELNYRPNSSARRLAGNRTYLLGLIYNAASSYVTNIQNGVLEACKDQHYDLLIHPCAYQDPNLIDELSELISSNRVDGLLLLPPMANMRSVHRAIDRHKVPSVSIARESVEVSDWTVGTNDAEVSAEMVSHLVQLGHSQIAFIQGSPDHKAMTTRFKGFESGMKDAGVKVQPDLCVQGGVTFESGAQCGEKLLQRKKPPTAIFCANDSMAAGVMHVAHQLGFSIPGDVSIAGFDDIPLASQVWPALTTIHQPMHDMARLAAQLLITRLRKEPPASIDRLVKSELVIRQSTGPAPG